MNKDFYRHDFECSPVECGCGGNYIDYKIVDIVQSLKDSVKREINIISGIDVRNIIILLVYLIVFTLKDKQSI